MRTAHRRSHAQITHSIILQSYPLPSLLQHIQKYLVIDEKMRADILKTYTVLTAIRTVSEPNHIEGENRGLSSMALAFVVIAPLTRSFFAILLWFIPMRAYWQRFLATVIDYLSVVAAPEVFGCTAVRAKPPS